MAGFLYTKNQFKISLVIPSLNLDSQSWDKWSGGGHTADTGIYPPGGMAPSVVHGGVTTRDIGTLERANDDTLIGLMIALDGALLLPCQIGVTPLKTATSAITAGRRNFTGIIRAVNLPEADSTSSDVQMIQVIAQLNETISN